MWNYIFFEKKNTKYENNTQHPLNKSTYIRWVQFSHNLISLYSSQNKIVLLLEKINSPTNKIYSN